MQSAIVSVILPYFNAEATLEQATQSILDQTFRDFELLLIDNNSNDGSLDIAKKLAASDQRIKLISESQQGVVFTANTGMEAALGKYIARMDADDIANPERLARQIKHLENNPGISISATQVNYKTEKLAKKDFSHFVDWSNQLNTWTEIYNNRFVEFPTVNPTLMFRKSILDDLGYLTEGDFPEDYEWFLRAIDQGHKIEKIATPLLDWYDYKSRLTRSDARYITEAFFRIKTKYLANHLKRIHQTKVWVWGAGKLGYKRSQILLDHGIEIQGYIDIKKEKQLAKYTCIHFEDLDQKNQPFILSYITNRDRRNEVREFLNQQNFREGENYIIAG